MRSMMFPLAACTLLCAARVAELKKSASRPGGNAEGDTVKTFSV
jgi:hypothetical protein